MFFAVPPKRKAEDCITEKYFWGNMKDYTKHAWDEFGDNWVSETVGSVNQLKEAMLDTHKLEAHVDTKIGAININIAAVKKEVKQLETSAARTSENIEQGKARMAAFEKSLKLQNEALKLQPKASEVKAMLQRLEKLETKFESHSQLEKELGRLQGRNEILERELKMAEQTNTLLSSQLRSQQDQV